MGAQRSSSGPSPFKPPSNGPTRTVIEAAEDAKNGQKFMDTERSVSVANRNNIGRPMPVRPWEQNRGAGYGSNYGGIRSMPNYNSTYGSMTPYNSGYTSGMYGSSNTYGGLGGYGSAGGGYSSGLAGGGYSSGLYGNNMYRGYGSQNGYGGMFNNGMGGPMGGYGLGPGGPYANGSGDPNNPYGGPPSPPSFWQSMLNALHGIVSFFGRVAILVDENTQAFHFFITALLQLFDRSGVLYGEIARFVLRLLGIRTKRRGMSGLDQDQLMVKRHPKTTTLKNPKGQVQPGKMFGRMKVAGHNNQVQDMPYYPIKMYSPYLFMEYQPLTKILCAYLAFKQFSGLIYQSIAERINVRAYHLKGAEKSAGR